MRRTQAPSQSTQIKQHNNSAVQLMPGASRSTSQLLSLLSSNSNVQPSPISDPVECSANNVETASKIDSDYVFSGAKKYFTVVWGKQTKKKHKTWEGDGTLVVENDAAVLKDQNGAILGRSSKLKTHDFESGYRLLIGSKEIEIIDILNTENAVQCIANDDCCISDESTKRKITIDSKVYSKKPFKRLKTASANFVSPLHSSSSECLAMPKPDHSHQWKYNTKNLPITDVKLDAFLSRLLRPHQQEGIMFLYSCITGIRDVEYTGAILADEMGLGKTLQCIALIWLLLKTGPYGGIPLVQRVLIVTPSSLVTNWLKEFKRWLTFQRLQPFIVNQKQKPSDFASLPTNIRPVMIISYEMLMRYYDDVKNIDFQLIICDEGHRLKNNQNRISVLLSQLEIDKKILLTGTPVQNNLQEFFALIDFVNPGVVGTYAEFKKYFELAIIAANEPECCVETKELGETRSRELNLKTNSFILRRTQSIINQYLPSKQESVIFCSPVPLQVLLYETVVAFWENGIYDEVAKVSHFNIITMLKKICNHPKLLKKEKLMNNADDDFQNLCNFDEFFIDNLQSIFREFYNVNEFEMSGKMIVLDKFLRELKTLNESVVLVSYFTQTLDMLEDLCNKRQYSFVRLDGNTSVSNRSEIVEKFNASVSKYFVFLLSAKAGGVGLNLIGASRLILFDLDWNPASDLQAMSRIWRDGQKKNVYIYRFLTTGSIEEKIYQRQISKTFLSNAVVDLPSNSNVRLSNEELKDLFSFRPDCDSLTHELLMCECEGNGVPETTSDHESCESERDERECQLSILHQQKSKNTSKISELIEWEHFSSPVDEFILEELCLKTACDHISFIFRNKRTESSNETN